MSSQCGVSLNRNSLRIPDHWAGQTSFLEAEYFEAFITVVLSFPIRIYTLFLFLVSDFPMMSNVFYLTDSRPGCRSVIDKEHWDQTIQKASYHEIHAKIEAPKMIGNRLSILGTANVIRSTSFPFMTYRLRDHLDRPDRRSMGRFTLCVIDAVRALPELHSHQKFDNRGMVRIKCLDHAAVQGSVVTDHRENHSLLVPAGRVWS